MRASLLCVAMCFCVLSVEAKPKARAYIRGTAADSPITGVVDFEEMGPGLKVKAELLNAPPGFHAFHVHEFGDPRDAGKAMGSHFNPDKAQHGHVLRDGNSHAHAGDFGNIEVDANGHGFVEFIAPKLNLHRGRYNIAGRGIVFHDKDDDFGQPVGNAGGRMAVGTIVLIED